MAGRRSLAVVLALCTAAALFGARGAAGQGPAGREPVPLMPPNAAALDALLANRQYVELGEIFRSARRIDEVVLNMNWQRAKMLSGATAFINVRYASDLWRVGSSVPGDQVAQVKGTAVMVLLYAMELSHLDGVKCQDQSAPVHRRDQLLGGFRNIWKYAATLSDEERAEIVRVALKLEQVTAPLRRDDEFLCRGGMDEMAEALKRQGDKPLPKSSPQPDQIGVSVEVPADPDYRPKFFAKEIWLPKQEAMRAKMPELLAQIMEAVKKAK